VPRLNLSPSQLEEKALDVRRNLVTALALHPIMSPGPSLAGADLLTTLFFYEINFRLDDLLWPERDIWHVSSRVLTPALHAVMAEVGYFPGRDLLQLGAAGHHLGGLPSSRTPGVEISAGTPGSGLSVAVGVALASHLDKSPRRVYCVMDDSEIQSGQVWEAAMAAAQFELDNLVLAVDLDGRQADGDIEEIVGLAPLAEKLRDSNWHVLEVDGNDTTQLVDAFNRSRSLHRAPTAILSCTTPGRGVGRFEESDAPLTFEDAGEALQELQTTLEDWRRRLEAANGHRAAGQKAGGGKR
jgi:transketolase